MSEHLVEIFRHNRWANLQILDWCAGLDEEIMEADAPGTFGTARTTIVHLIGAEERYVELLTGETIAEGQRLEPDGPFPDFNLLRERLAASGQRLIEIAGTAPTDQILEGRYLDGRPYRLRATTLLIQAVHHAAEHRTHIMTVISQHGVNVPDTDGWSYGEEVLTTS